MDWFTQFGRRILEAYQEGLEMTCAAHCANGMAHQFGRIDNPLGTTPMFTGPTVEASVAMIAAARIDGRQDDVAQAIQPGSAVRH